MINNNQKRTYSIFLSYGGIETCLEQHFAFDSIEKDKELTTKKKKTIEKTKKSFLLRIFEIKEIICLVSPH